MLKLVKYEFRKQLFSKVMILVILALLQVGFMIGLFFEKERLLATSMGLYLFLSIASVLFVAFESINTYSNDLKTKQSYMLFLTPNSTYKIVGAKVLSTIVTIGLTAAVFVGATLIDFAAVLVKYDKVAKVIELIQEFSAKLFQANIDYAYIISFVIYFLFDLIAILIIGMASITLSATFLSNSKGKAVVSIIFFFGINFVLGRIEGWVLPARSLTSTDPYYINCVWSLGVIVVFYFLTSYMLDKKVSV